MPATQFNLDDEEAVLVGRAIPAAAAFLGLAFMACTLLLAGLPPLSGFIGKFAMLTALLNPLGLGTSAGLHAGTVGWIFLALLIASGLLALIAFSRAGIRHFWSAHNRPTPRLRVFEGLPIAALLAACIGLTVAAAPAMRFAQATADSLYSPGTYVRAVMSAKPVPSPSSAPALPNALSPPTAGGMP